MHSVLSDYKGRPLSYRFQFSLYSMHSVGLEDHGHTNSNSNCIQCIQWETCSNVIPILISLYLVYPMGNEDHCHTDSNSHSIQCYPMGNEDHCHTNSDSQCIQCYPIRNEDQCHTDSNSNSTQCIRCETRTTVIPILILVVFSVSPLSRQSATGFGRQENGQPHGRSP